MAYPRYQFSVVDEAGNVVPLAHITVRREVPGAPLIALYEDRDATSALGNPFDADANGFAFFHVAPGVYRIDAALGAFAAEPWRYVEIPSSAGVSDREVTAAGAVTVTTTDRIIRVNKTVSQATTANLVGSAAFEGEDLIIKDQKGDATNYQISVTPSGSETIDGQTGARLIDWPYGALKLRPVTGGWITL